MLTPYRPFPRIRGVHRDPPLLDRAEPPTFLFGVYGLTLTFQGGWARGARGTDFLFCEEGGKPTRL